MIKINDFIIKNERGKFALYWDNPLDVLRTPAFFRYYDTLKDAVSSVNFGIYISCNLKLYNSIYERKYPVQLSFFDV